MTTPKGWKRHKEKEKNDVVKYWKNNQDLVVAIKQYSSDMRPNWDDYEVVMLDKKNYGGAPISNRRKTVGTGNNKERLRKAVVGWMRDYPEATRSDFDSLQTRLRRSK